MLNNDLLLPHQVQPQDIGTNIGHVSWSARWRLWRSWFSRVTNW